MQRGGLGAGDRRVRRIALALHPLDAHRRVGERLDRALRQRREERRALRERLRMRVDLAQLVERHVGEADQAHLDAQHFLADDGEIGVGERVVGVVHRSRRRVLDRQHRVVGGARPHFLEHRAEGRRRRGRSRRAGRGAKNRRPAMWLNAPSAPWNTTVMGRAGSLPRLARRGGPPASGRRSRRSRGTAAMTNNSSSPRPRARSARRAICRASRSTSRNGASVRDFTSATRRTASCRRASRSTRRRRSVEFLPSSSLRESRSP